MKLTNKWLYSVLAIIAVLIVGSLATASIFPTSDHVFTNEVPNGHTGHNVLVNVQSGGEMTLQKAIDDGKVGSVWSIVGVNAVYNSGSVGINDNFPGAPLVVREVLSGNPTYAIPLRLQTSSGNADDRIAIGFSHGSDSTGANDRARFGVHIIPGGNGDFFWSTRNAGTINEVATLSNDGTFNAKDFCLADGTCLGNVEAVAGSGGADGITKYFDVIECIDPADSTQVVPLYLVGSKNIRTNPNHIVYSSFIDNNGYHLSILYEYDTGNYNQVVIQDSYSGNAIDACKVNLNDIPGRNFGGSGGSSGSGSGSGVLQKAWSGSQYLDVVTSPLTTTFTHNIGNTDYIMHAWLDTTTPTDGTPTKDGALAIPLGINGFDTWNNYDSARASGFEAKYGSNTFEVRIPTPRGGARAAECLASTWKESNADYPPTDCVLSGHLILEAHAVGSGSGSSSGVPTAKETVTCTAGSSISTCIATCPAGKFLAYGGCDNGNQAGLASSHPVGDTQWRCKRDGSTATTMTGYAVCE